MSRDEIRNQIIEEIGEQTGVDPNYILIDVPTVPSVPYYPLLGKPSDIPVFQSLPDGTKERRTLSEYSPIIDALIGYMDIVRIYNTPQFENKVRKGAAEIFGKMVCALGGPADFVENYDNYLQKSEIIRPVYAPHSGIVQSMDTRALGMAVVNMGGGRMKSSDSIDYAVGLNGFVSIGDQVSSERPLAMVHARTEAQFTEAERAIQRAIICGTDKPETETQVYRRIRLQDIS